jgi:glycosyltransferase involved in cell wall biosynthesis
MITIVIPVYNAAKFIPRCVSCLESQTRHDFKVIFVDDGSIDDSITVLNKIEASTFLDITIVRNNENRGPAYSRNEGIIRAQSDFITFCDCDDWYDSRFIEVLAGLIEDTEADIVFCGYNVVNEKGSVKKRPLNVANGVVPNDVVFGLDVDSLCMMMTKTSLMKETLLPDIRNGEDVATVSVLLAKARVVAATNECLYNYYRRSGSASETPSMKVVDSLIDSFEYTRNHFPHGKEVELEFLGIKNMLYSSLVSLFSFSYDIDKADRILDQFESVFPKWNKNKYLKSLTRYKRIVLLFLKNRVYFVVKGIALLRKAITK